MHRHRPNFLVIGAAKCASTSMCALLGEHPEVFMCEPKEPRFFSRDEVYARGWEWYGSLFSGADGKKAIGEGSVCYGNPLRHHSLIGRLKQDLGDLKFIYMVRHPLKRIESDWKMRRHLQDAECCSTLSATIECYPNILEHSLYWQQLQQYFQAFRPEQFLIIFFEDFVKNPTAETERALRHLGVTPLLPEHAAPTKARNSSQEYQVESKWMQLARRLPGFGLMKSLVPTTAIASLKQRFTKTVEYTPDWEPRVKQQVVAQLQPDVQSLLAFTGKPANYWALQ